MKTVPRYLINKGKKFTQQVSKCKLYKNPIENDNFSHKTSFFAYECKSVIFSGFSIYIHVFDMCFFGLSNRIQGTTFMLMLSSSISDSQLANFYF
jgi:hypothetical protein